jgi:hypothetical protein
LLRERLESATGEYLEQKDRTIALENQQAKNALELRQLAELVAHSGEPLCSASIFSDRVCGDALGDGLVELKTCQSQLVDALARSNDLEAKLAVADAR